MSAVAALTRRSLLALAGAGLISATLPANAAQRPVLLATTSQVAELLRAVAGDTASISSLMGEGIDPHSYKLTRSDTVALMKADAVFHSGLYLEGKMADMLDKLSAGKPVYAAASVLPSDKLIHPDGADAHPDPHVWMDPSLWQLALLGVRDKLSGLYPANATLYAANTAKAAGLYEALHGYAGKVLASVPDPRRVLVTAHDAFSYLGRAYGLEVVGIQGISTESEAGLQRIESMVSLLVDRKIPAVFVETSVSDRNIQALIQGAAAKGHTVAIGGSLYSDAMGAPGTYEGTYVGMIDHNVTTIAQALGGTVPTRGFQGRLAAG
ncbi:metal ABC transporter solute-binding protein, Zn/Mn family [Niveispirillum lacus]|uniref:metal ABC transporter solute-binding protein, Zn/Mn family n=1 Tax=Niveispirillum lacus TaxID=1981099 RepID=UPI001FEC54BF|nr:zinc ABC transporter substrate-binding protein [Niveispirillum lacus]